MKVVAGHFRPPLSGDMPQGYKDLLSACWDEDPAQRPSFEDIERCLRAQYIAMSRAMSMPRN